MIVVMITGLCFFDSSIIFSASDKVLARIGDKVITQTDLSEWMKRYETLRKGNPFTYDEKKELLNKIIKGYLIGIEAEREKIDKKPEFQARLNMYRNELLVREYITQKVDPLIKLKDSELEEIMKKYPQLVPKEMLTLKEILVKTEKEAEEIYQELKKGADFSKMVTEKSISQTKTKDGLIGTISRGQLPPPLEEAAFQLKEGEFSKPVNTAEGFRILYLVSKKQRSQEEGKELEGKVREKVIQMEKSKRAQAMIEEKVEALRKQLKVETYFDQLK